VQAFDSIVLRSALRKKMRSHHNDEAAFLRELNAQDGFGYTPLHHAVVRGDVTMFALLLHAGADAFQTKTMFVFAFHFFVLR